MSRILVIGGANTDIFGMSAAGFVPGDSNPGVVRLSGGGVARNIAENLVRLGEEVELLTALGDDHAASVLADHCREVGIGLDLALTVPGATGSVYLAVLDESGDLAAAVSDMRVTEALTAEAVSGVLAGLAPPDALVLDTNVTARVIAAASSAFPGVPVFADCVSASKAPRITGSLARITGLHANALEAETLTGFEVAGVADGAARAAEALHDRGVGSVLITEGARGVYHSSADDRGWIPAPEVEVVNVTGAGDAFMAGVVWSTLKGSAAAQAARFGVAAASITLRASTTVAPDMSGDTLHSFAEGIRP